MTFFKVIAGFVLFAEIFHCDAQFLTPDQLREQHEIGYGARTHYEMSGTRLTDMFNRVNPDYLFRGFFPFWSIVLIAAALIFLLIALIGLIGYFLGCRRPTAEELRAKEFGQFTPDDEYLLSSNGANNEIDDSLSPLRYAPETPVADFRYDSQTVRPSQIRVGQSDEDMV